ncbi:type II secretion system secretin GspD [Pseudomonas fluorescens group sp.]|uniref:General secretion pathway protein D/Q n=2 Tax=Pseudomonas fluorescens TaxID=294 RepID=C3KC62_PSEFS|nr:MULTISPECIES: type II secretion system secretin GspD [Pseudomonas fluorescens group]MBZ6454260.1 type II secretion system secretin GspD [Pseudomonas fluorescens group sp.]MBZ6460246.1 type II secretion system secretin GspD [Pseudomonas fluorescens group sp.]MBZ6465887.1 type II secretion system secretin GspD [Pseudomonas fluorescens group sp.]WQD69606.1 type II secretion system secretin GspD [Pseudomonas marginalis]CAI2797448.1 General secretion pathway protein D/Q [Pseudomonas fluorescens 
MKWSGSNYVRNAAPFLLLALSACSTQTASNAPPLLVDSELGQPLANTQRSGDVLLERQRAQTQIERQARPQRTLVNPVRRGGASIGGTTLSNPLGSQPVSLNFVDADIQAVVRGLSRATGRQFLVDPRVTGSLTLVSEGEVPAHQAYDMLLAALRMQGFSVVDVGGVAHVVPEADAKLLGGPVYSADRPAANGMLTRTFRLHYENAVNLIPVLRPIVSPNNPINAYPGNNTLVITDYADNLARVAQLIDSIDSPSAIDTDVVQVQNGIAVDIAGMVSQLLEQPGSDATQKISVVGDPRSNSIIIRAGSPERTELARNLVYKLDNAQSNPSNLHVVYLRNAQAAKLAQALRGLLTGESDSGTGDTGRSVLSAMGGNTSGGQSGQNSPSSTSQTSSSGSSSSNGTGMGYGQSGGNSSSQAGAQATDQSVAFSAGGVTIQADATTNTLLISAPEPLYRNLREVIDMLDQRRAQVVIESLIVEVGEDDANEFGVQWQSGDLAGKGVIGGTNLGGSGLQTGGLTSIDALPGGLSVGYLSGTVNIPGVGNVMDLKVLARALKSKGGSNVLSTPNLLTLDNEAASIFVGQTIPFVSGSYVTGGGGTSNNPFQTVTREEVGLKLNVRPQISEGGTVKLDIYQEVSSIDERASSSATSAGVVTNKRAIDTSILLDDGQIMVLGGLLQDGYSQSNEAVPWLSSIPGLGALFRNERRATTKTNLMVFLRPYIIRDSAGGRAITLNRYDFIRRAQGALQPERSWAMPGMQAPQLPAAAVGVPAAPGSGQPRATIRAVPLQ